MINRFKILLEIDRLDILRTNDQTSEIRVCELIEAEKDFQCCFSYECSF